MQHCHFCGSEFPDNARFCGNCGRTPTSHTALDIASPPFASPSERYMNTIANTLFPQVNQPDEEERRRSILPIPLPFGTDSPLVGSQVPMVQGTPSFSGVPYVQVNTPEIAGSVPPSNMAASVPTAAPSTAQPVSFGHQAYSWSSQPASHSAHLIGVQSHEPPVQERPGRQHHHPKHHQQHVQHTIHTTGTTTKVILIVTIGVVVIAVGISTLVFALRSHLPSLAGIIPASSSNSSIISSSHNSNATACVISSSTPCMGATSPSSPIVSGQSTGTFNFSGAVSGVLVITSFPVCAVLQGNTYSLQVIGTIGGTQYKFIIGILAYKGPGIYTSQLTVNLIRGSGANVGELSNDGRLPVSIIITNGGKAGKVNSDLEGILKLSDVQLSKVHILASWTCG